MAEIFQNREQNYQHVGISISIYVNDKLYNFTHLYIYTYVYIEGLHKKSICAIILPHEYQGFKVTSFFENFSAGKIFQYSAPL